ncbi:MAG: UbiD family decarboxylase [Candidatus Bathyarchaeia archaeon]
MRSLRTYLERLQKVIPDQFVRVREPVDWQYEVTAYVAEMERDNSNPALLFENIKDYSTPLLINLFGHVDRIILALGDTLHIRGSRLDFYNEWNRLFDKEVPPVCAGRGPVKDICHRGDDVDLASLPIPKFYEQDGGRYVTAGLLVARNPDHPEEINLTYARMHLKGRDRFGISLHSRGHTWQYLEKAKAAGEPLDVAVIIGAHPALYLAAAAKITNEYHRAGALIGEPIELIRCGTVDLPVPAQAEIVLEGQILLDEEDEGPFTEYTGYISGRSTRNLLRVSAITRREDAIFLAVAPSNSSEHLLLSGLPKQARIYQAMIDFIHTPALKDIIWPVWGTHFVCFISLKESMELTPGLAKQLGLLLLGLDHYVKIVAVFPADTDISNVTSALGSIALRCDLKDGSGLEVLGKVFSHLLDPSSAEAGISSKMVIDASRPGMEIVSPNTEADLRNVLSAHKIKDASFPCKGNPHFCVVNAKPDLGDLTELLDMASLNRCRLIICVDEDIDIHDGRQILWALATRSQPKDAIIREGRMMLDARKGNNWTARRATLPSYAPLLAARAGDFLNMSKDI